MLTPSNTQRRRLPNGSLLHVKNLPANLTTELLAAELHKAGVDVPLDCIDIRPNGKAVLSVPPATVAALLQGLLRTMDCQVAPLLTAAQRGTVDWRAGVKRLEK